MKLREYQKTAVDQTLEEFQDKQSLLVVMATGLGKTVVAAHIADAFKDKGRILLLAHREELITQGRNTFEKVTGLHAEVEMADQWARKSNGTLFGGSNLIVSSIQTQIAGRDGRRMERFRPEEFAFVFVDEAHHATSSSYRAVLDYYKQNPNIKILGVTATPDRTDEEALGQIFDDVTFEYGIGDGINDGWLVPLMQQAVHVEGLDYSAIHTVAGDLNGGELAEVLEFEENLHGMASPLLDICGDKKTLIFTATVAQAERMAEILNRHRSNCAEYVSGETPKDYRRELFKRYAAGQFQFLCNVGVATEGFDEPGIEFIVMARPTKSRALFTQMCLDSSTEILTNKGWHQIDDQFEIGELAAAFTQGGRITWQPIEQVIRRKLYDNECFYGIENPHLDIRVTNLHNMVVRTRNGRKRARTPWRFETAEQCANLPDTFEIPVAATQNATGVPLTDDEIRFIGLYMTDGNLNPHNNAVTLYQSERYPENIEYIEKVIRGCNFKAGHKIDTEATNFGPRTPLHRWWISRGKPRGTDKDKRGWGDLAPYMDKELSPELENMTRGQLLILLEAMYVGDGIKQKHKTWNARSISICTGRGTLSDRLQSMCVRRGLRCNIGLGGSGRSMKILHISADRSVWSIKRQSADGRPVWRKLNDACDGELVWCITVPSGMIVTRRKGKVAIVGNCGRGTRPLSGVVDGLADAEARKAAIAASAKPFMQIVDFVGNAGKHKLIHATDVLGGKYSDEIVELAERNAEKSGKPVDIATELVKAEREIERRRRMREEAAQRAHLKLKSKYSTSKIDPFDVLDVMPCREPGWHKGRPPSPKQRELLEKWGVPVPENLTFVHASQLIGKLIKNRNEGKCSFKQAKKLQQYGFPTTLTFEQASRIMTMLANNGWKHFDPKSRQEILRGLELQAV